MRPILVALLLLAGCGSTQRPSAPYAVSPTLSGSDERLLGASREPASDPPPAAGPRADPVVVAHGFTAVGEAESATYAVVLRNPNTTAIPTYLDVTATFLDSNGEVVTTVTQAIPGIFADAETAIGGAAPGAGDAVAMEVEIASLNLLPTRIRESLGAAGGFEYEGIESTADASGRVTTAGVIVSEFSDDQVDVPLHVVHYDARGAIVGGAVAAVHRVPAGGKAQFEATTAVPIGDVAETRLFGHIGFGN